MDDVKEMTQKGYTHTHMKTWDSQDFSIGPSPLKSRFTEKNGSRLPGAFTYIRSAMPCGAPQSIVDDVAQTYFGRRFIHALNVNSNAYHHHSC